MKYTAIVCSQEHHEPTTNVYRVVVEEGVAENATEAAEAAKEGIRDCLEFPSDHSVWVEYIFAGEQEPLDIPPPEHVLMVEKLKALSAKAIEVLGHPLPVRNILEAEVLLAQKVWAQEDFNEWHDAHFD